MKVNPNTSKGLAVLHENVQNRGETWKSKGWKGSGWLRLPDKLLFFCISAYHTINYNMKIATNAKITSSDTVMIKAGYTSAYHLNWARLINS